MSALLDAIRRFFYPIGAAFLGRGEVADAPCACRACKQLDEEQAFGIDPIDIAIWEHELTREEQ